MNLQELWSGNDYAWYQSRGKGETYRANAVRVKIVRAFKRQASLENERMSGYADVLLVDEETGEPRTNTFGEHLTTEVRARDIAMRWDEYESERDHRKAQAEKYERERQARYDAARKEREEREARQQKERQEQEAKEQEVKRAITDMLVNKYGIPREYIYSLTHSGVYLSRAALEKELGLVSEQP